MGRKTAAVMSHYPISILSPSLVLKVTVSFNTRTPVHPHLHRSRPQTLSLSTHSRLPFPLPFHKLLVHHGCKGRSIRCRQGQQMGWTSWSCSHCLQWAQLLVINPVQAWWSPQSLLAGQSCYWEIEKTSFLIHWCIGRILQSWTWIIHQEICWPVWK